MKNTTFEISPLDGRYKGKVEDLALIFSEYGLMKARFQIEVSFLLALEKVKVLPRKILAKEIAYLNSLVENFSIEDYEQIKNIEKVTNHDVKAVEYFLKEKIKD
ncbi:MAG: adenylosuccinate lyase, partial [bacterium]